MQRVCGHFVLKTIVLPLRVTLAEVFIFIPLVHSPPFLRFLHILLYANFFMMRNTVFLPWMMQLIGERQPFLLSASSSSF